MNLQESISGSCGLEICVTRRQNFLDRRYCDPAISTVDLRLAERQTARIERLLKDNHFIVSRIDQRTNDH
jgi:hypothetical protein